MENDKITFVSSLLKEKNSQIMHENFELSQKISKLTTELELVSQVYKKIKNEKTELEFEFKKELER